MEDRTLVALIIIEILITIGSVVNCIQEQEYMERKFEQLRNGGLNETSIMLFPREEKNVLQKDNKTDCYLTGLQMHQQILRDLYGYDVRDDGSYITTVYLEKQRNKI